MSLNCSLNSDQKRLPLRVRRARGRWSDVPSPSQADFRSITPRLCRLKRPIAIFRPFWSVNLCSGSFRSRVGGGCLTNHELSSSRAKHVTSRFPRLVRGSFVPPPPPSRRPIDSPTPTGRRRRDPRSDQRHFGAPAEPSDLHDLGEKGAEKPGSGVFLPLHSFLGGREGNGHEKPQVTLSEKLLE